MADNGKQANVAVAEREQAAPPRRFGQLEHMEQFEKEFGAMRERMWDLFRRPFARVYGPSLLTETTWAPTVDAYEKDGTLVIKAELPGVKQEDIAISAQSGYLTLEAKRAEEKEAKEARYYTSERFSGMMRRSFALPDGVDTGAISATFQDGVLELRVPLPAAAKSDAVQIPVNG